jgi:hypothetical protein
MEIKAGTVYEHDEYDQVVVLGVHRVYQTYETDTDEGTVTSVVVQWADEWDAYGSLWGRSQSQPLDEFLAAVGDPIDDVNFTTPGQ